MKNKKTGKVYLVGAGPGDIGLFTLKGKECVEKADVVIYDYLANEKLLSFARSDAKTRSKVEEFKSWVDCAAVKHLGVDAFSEKTVHGFPVDKKMLPASA